jgi:hypothetical protein
VATALVARGPGPRWLRYVLVGVAAIYFFMLLKHPSERWQPLSFFVQATKLFPEADDVALEYRLDAWSCDARAWVPLDPRPFFPIEADDKESRFQRFGYFYADRGSRADRRLVLRALDDYIVERHGHVDDGLAGAIGGIRMYKWRRTLPKPGDPVPRYVYRPLAPVPADERTELFHTVTSTRKERCAAAAGSAKAGTSPPAGSSDEDTEHSEAP